MTNLNNLDHQTILDRKQFALDYVRTMIWMAEVHSKKGHKESVIKCLEEAKKSKIEAERIQKFLDADRTITLVYKVA